MKREIEYPDHAFKSKRYWLRSVRKRWVTFRKYDNQYDSVRCGCFYYPKEVYDWLNQFEKMDKIMREYYNH